MRPLPTRLLLIGLGGLLACGREDEDSGAQEVVLVDEDGDGWALPYDCDDDLPGIHPGAAELCNAGDDDCDGVVDDHPADGIWAWLDMDRDGWGDAATQDLWCGDAEQDTRPWVSNDGDCDDGNHAIHPSAFETCDGDADQDCDGTANDVDASGCAPWYEDRDGDGVGIERSLCLCVAEGSYRATVDGDCDDDDPAQVDTCGLTGARDLDAADIAIVGASPLDRAGAAVAAGGDADGDGWPDLLLGGPNEAARPSWWLVRGPFDGNKDLGAPSAEFQEQVLRTGASVSLSGGVDLTGDGADDLVIAGYGVAAAATSRWVGVAYVVSGAVSGTVNLESSAARFEGARSATPFAIRVAALPDTDGDGVGDLLIGGSWGNAAWLFRGPLDGGLQARDAACTLSGIGDTLGNAVASAGDVDGDGLTDLVVGAQTAGTEQTGAAWLVAGGTSGTIVEADATAVMWGTRPGELTGASVSGPGDVDGDGYDDVVVGGPATVDNLVQAGSVWLLRGPVAGTISLDDAAARVDGLSVLEGAFVTGRAGDLDGDGAAELVIGAPGNDAAGVDAGAAMVFFGPLDGVVSTLDADLRLYGLAARDAAGSAAAGVGDLDQDGFDDLAIGVPGLDSGADDGGGAFVVRGGAR